MKISAKKSTEKLLVLRYYSGYDIVIVTTILSFFLAGLMYWFLFPKAHFDDWKHVGPLLKRTPNEVLFRVPLQENHQNIYVPLDAPFIRHVEESADYDLIFIGRTSEKRKVNKKYELKAATYHTKEDAKKHYDEVMAFLRSSDPIFLNFQASVEDRRSPEEKWLKYTPFLIAFIVSFLVFMIKSSYHQLILDKRNGKGKLQIGNLLIRTSKIFAISELKEATLDQSKNALKDDSKLLKLQLHLNGKKLTVCKYSPPYDDDKMIIALVQHARLINWWKDDNFMSKYGDRVLEET
ncbi:MAG: hypothetical protein ACI85I_002392 [Arenicella sp.]|jgi:hypothetical protein